MCIVIVNKLRIGFHTSKISFSKIVTNLLLFAKMNKQFPIFFSTAVIFHSLKETSSQKLQLLC